MMFKANRALAVLFAVAFIVHDSYLQPTAAQQKQVIVGGGRIQPGIQPVGPPGTKPPPGPATGDASDLNGITLPSEEKYAKKIQSAVDYINVERWEEAVALLQELLDIQEDVFAPVTRKTIDGKVTKTMASVRNEAARLVSELPPKGMDFYKTTYGPPAATLLKTATEGGDAKGLAEIMRRYLYTDAGVEATQLLATYLLDRGQYSAAGLCYERLIQRLGSKELPPLQLFKAAIAFRYTGDTARLDAVWKQLAARGANVQLGEKAMSVADLKAYVDGRRSIGISRTRYDWLMAGGDSTRSAQGDGGTAFLDPMWKHPTITEATTKAFVNRAKEKQEARKIPVLPGFSPIATTVNTDDGKVPLMIYKDFWGIHARAVRDVGKDTKAGEIFWEAPSTWSIDRMVREPRHVGPLQQWISMYVDNDTRPSAVYENSTVGSLSTDNARVYMVEDFMVPPYTPHVQPGFPGQPGAPGMNGALGDAIHHNCLQAYELDSGKLLWEAPEPKHARDDKDPLGNSYFLGPPLPLNGKLFVLNERDQELRLVTLEPATGRVVGKPQRLADTREKMTADTNRRINAAHLAYGEGILVCPTNSGGLLGVDLLTNSLVWAYGYRERGYTSTGGQQGNPLGNGQIQLPDGRVVWATAVAPNWHTTPPIIVGGKVVFTAPDAGAVHCLNLRDGTCLWKNARREGDLYVGGVYDGKVLVIGKGYARALDLKDGGKELWTVETGTPSGIGIASKDLYYLPLKEGIKSREPEICIIDVPKGLVAAHTRSRKKEVPGSLLFYDGTVLSQGLMEVAAFPQLEVELKKIDTLLAANPKDAIGLTKRGDLRLDRGDLAGAIEDLRMALANLPPNPPEGLVPKAREKLYESLTEYFQRDFDAAEKAGYLKEYEAMCSVVTPDMDAAQKQKALAEEKKRKGNFYCLVGKGKEAQGLADKTPEGQKKLVEAFEAYMNFGALGEVDQEMMSVVDDPGVKASPMVWARGRISAMVSGATKEQRGPLEAVIAQRWEKVKAAGDVESLRNFANTFGDISIVGREARLTLAEKLITDGDAKTLVEAERHLHLLRTQSDDPVMSGRAVEAMARLMTARGLMEDAAYFFRVLARDYAKVVIKDGKTGQDFYNDLATDKRFLPFLDEPAQLFGVRMTAENVREQEGNFGYYNQYLLEQFGEKLPFFNQNKLAMRIEYHQFRMFDRDTGAEAWTQNLTQTHFTTLIQRMNTPQLTPRFGYRNIGHLVVLQLGHMVYALDPVNKQVLWEKNLSRTSSLPVYARHVVDPKDGSTQVFYQDGFTQRLGNTGQASAIAVVMPTHDALIAVDPITGKELWNRSDVTRLCHIYNDDRYVYVIEVGNDGTTIGATRVFRLQDGVSVGARDFGEVYGKRTAIVGRSILVADSDAGGVTLRLYDILTGQDRWKQQFKAGTHVLQSDNVAIGGAVEPDGKATVVDFGLDRPTPGEPKVLFTAQMKPEHLARVSSLHLLRDQKDVYIACNGQADQQILAGSMASNIMPYTGIRVLPVNGELYSFDGKTGTLNWHNSCANQMVVQEEFHSLPMVVLTSRYRKWVDNLRGQATYVVATRAYDKQTGKLIFDKESSDMNRYQQFHSVRVDNRTGRFELISNNMKVVFQILANATALADPPPRGGIGRGSGIDNSVPGDIVPPPLPPGGRVIRGRAIAPPVPMVLPPGAVPPRIIID